MSGPGDIEGEVSGDEAAWRDLVARFDRPADLAPAQSPWPAREDLPADAQGEAAGPDADPPTEPGGPGRDAVGPGILGPGLPGPDALGPGPLGPDALGPDALGPAALPSFDRARIIRPASDPRLTGDPRSYAPAEENDEPYIPAPLPPPGKLDPIAKAAWAGVICGPGYLLIASLILHWTISAVDAFLAVAAFIGGFVTLVIKLGDHPRDDDDDGAVL
jgi:hypothetical protein